jgi:hypothetical protein
MLGLLSRNTARNQAVNAQNRARGRRNLHRGEADGPLNEDELFAEERLEKTAEESSARLKKPFFGRGKSSKDAVAVESRSGDNYIAPENVPLRFMFHPSIGSKMNWDGVLIVLVVYSSLSVPYRIGFDEDTEGDWAGFDRFTEVFCSIDICLNFATGYQDAKHFLVYDKREIACGAILLPGG